MNIARPIYLDYAATTPVDPQVARLMSECLTEEGVFGNASSTTHAYGRSASLRVETARSQVATLIGAQNEEIIFTSGATESSNLAIFGAARANAHRGKHIITARTEHKAVLDPCKRLEKEGWSVTYLTPDRNGVLAPEAIGAAFRADTVLVAIMHVNNEIGVINDIAAIGALCRERDVIFYSDAAQSVGKLPIDVSNLPVDLLSFTAHKFYGPKGIGALYVRGAARPRLQAVSFGGGQESGLRAGTLPTHQIVGFGQACAIAAEKLPLEQAQLSRLTQRLSKELQDIEGVHFNAQAAPRVANILNMSFDGVEGESLIAGLAELALSTGSACSSATAEPSYVLRALGRNAQLAQSSLRFSVGRGTSEADIDRAILAIKREITRLRGLSPAATGSMYVPADGEVVSGEAGSPAKEAWVRVHLLIGGEVVKDARFQAYGCPHTLAVAFWLAERLRGRHRTDLVPEGPQDWAKALEVPVEKLGRLLIVEDSLRNALQHWSQRL